MYDVFKFQMYDVLKSPSDPLRCISLFHHSHWKFPRVKVALANWKNMKTSVRTHTHLSPLEISNGMANYRIKEKNILWEITSGHSL